MRSHTSVPQGPETPSPVALCPVVCFPYLPGGTLRPRRLQPLCPTLSRSRPKPVAPIMRGEIGRFPGSYKGTLTREGGLLSAFPPVRAVKTETDRCVGLTVRLSISRLTHGSIFRPRSPSSTPSIRHSRCVSHCHVSPSPLTDSPFLSNPHVRLLPVGVPRTARVVL
jgi:hypothetical protein